MKKTALIFACLCITSVSFAQIPFTFGPKIGADFSTLPFLKKDTRLRAEHLAGFAVGAFGRVNLGKLYLQPELYYTRKEGQPDVRQNAATPLNDKAKHSFDIPVLLGYKIVNLKIASLRMMAGPVACYTHKDGRTDMQVSNPANYAFNTANLGFQAGVGVDIANLTMDIRYEGGLHKISSNFNQRISLFHISLGFKFF